MARGTFRSWWVFSTELRCATVTVSTVLRRGCVTLFTVMSTPVRQRVACGCHGRAGSRRSSEGSGVSNPGVIAFILLSPLHCADHIPHWQEDAECEHQHYATHPNHE